MDLTHSCKLAENSLWLWTSKKGKFVEGEIARALLHFPNPNGKPNRDVLRPMGNGMDITRRWSDSWIVDFGANMSESDAALYVRPFAHVSEYIKGQSETKWKSTHCGGFMVKHAPHCA